MSKINEDINLKRNYKYFDKLLRIFLIIGIIIISSFIVFNLNNLEPGYTTFGILNSQKKAGDYPKSINVSENVTFYITIGNYLQRDFTFQIEILKGDNDTILSSTEPSVNSKSYLNVSIFRLLNNQNWISEELNVSFASIGTNRIIIVELWEVNNDLFREKFTNALWLKLNVTN
jgi:uncharacterized membrane protein